MPLRSSSQIIEQEPPKNICEWMYRFVSAEAAWTFALVFTYLLFFVLAVPDFIEYGYSDDKKANDGGIQSGPSGSGLFIVSLLLFICCTVTYGMKLVRCACSVGARRDARVGEAAHARGARLLLSPRDARSRARGSSPLTAAYGGLLTSRPLLSPLLRSAARSSTSCPDCSRDDVLGGNKFTGRGFRPWRYTGHGARHGGAREPQPHVCIFHAARLCARRCSDGRLDT